MNHKTTTHNTKHLLRAATLLAALLLCPAAWGQVADGIYYIRNNNNLSYGYLWPSLTTHSTTGYRYLTTSLDTIAAAVTNNNGVTYPAHDKSYSHWVVKNVTGGYIQLINPRLNKYVAIRVFPKTNNTKTNDYGDRDVWLTDEPAAGDIEYTYLKLNNASAPYKISPKAGLNSVSTTSGYSLNSASGNSDREWLTWSKTDNKPQNGEGREGLIQFYSGGTPAWSFTADSLDAPAISDVSSLTGKVTVTDNNGLPAGYNIRYTVSTNGNAPADPTASSTIMTNGEFPVGESCILKAVVERYGVVLTAVATKALEPVPCATPVISFDNSTLEVSITCATESSSIYYTTNGNTPTTSSNPYSAPFSVDGPTTVKAIATHATLPSSAVAELAITQVATPTIQNNGSNAISITCATEGATIYYTTDDANPTTTSTEYTVPLTEEVSNVTIKAIAVKENMITSAVGSGTVKLQCATPVITRNGLTFTLSCSKPTDATLYYTLGGGSEVAYSGDPVSFSSDQLPMNVTAVARHSDYTPSELASMEFVNGAGTADDPYLIYGTTDFTNFVTNVNDGSTASAYYKLATDVSASGMDAITTPFTGNFDGGMHIISNLGHPLFNKVNGGTVKNVMLDDVTISSGTNVGAVCGEATGDSRIYNCGVLATGSTVTTDEDGYTKITSCSSTIAGSNYVGGLVGLLDGTSRVINCFSYANITGGAEVGGIVGHNNLATTAAADNLKTMVMNCMFYGEVSGTSIAPIYNGQIITNDGDANGVNNFNYFRLEAAYIQNTDITKVYNCALGAETRFLQRFEFFRHLLNSNRELAAWWASTSSTAVTKGEIMKWVLEPTQIGTTTPYPILKTPGKYASVVNIDAEHAATGKPRNKGGKLGTLTVNIQMGDGAVYNHPGTGENEAQITTSQLILNITDKDTAHFNFNYYKVQLPYYNDVGTKNYTGNRVVTGWKIVSITVNGNATTEGTGSYSTGDDVTYENGELTATPYNFADRSSTKKDLYSKSGRVFNQGAYWDVPEGVTAITIEPYWGKAVYLADAYWDVVYKNGSGNGTAAGTAYDAMTTAANVPNVGGGERYNNSSTFNGQVVFTFIEDAISSSKDNGLFKGVTGTPANQTVYDYAVVLVGNYHHTTTPNADNSKPYTVTSVDLDGDNEPDYSLMLRFNNRLAFHPVRYDFLNLMGLGMAQKTTGGKGSYNLGIMQPKAWFEVTNTALFRVTQFEYSRADRVKNPYIIQGGVIEQWVTQQQDAGDRVSYFHIGGNVWFKEFHRGSHQDNAGKSTPHPPVSVTGGDYNKFYLTGLYQSQAKIYDDNAECYITGGRFGEVAGAGMEGIGTSDGKGNITWVIDNADITEFYGGGINYDKPVHGNIHTIISNSHVDIFCGGPKFGDMVTGKTVTTRATNCTFGTYFGAGYGGNSYSRQAPRNHNNIVNFPHNDNQAGNDASWNAWLNRFYKQEYNATYGGVSTQFDYQFLPMSSNTENVARIFVEYVGFSLATTHNVTSSLTDCTVTGNFYGGGSLGKVEGNVISVLDSCTVQGSVFGAGYSASRPTVAVDSLGFRMEPYYYEDLGTYRNGVKGVTTPYTWEHRNTVDKTSNAIDKTNHILYTTEDLSETNLGSVEGNAILTLQGTTRVDGNVYGGGDQSVVKGANEGNTTVILKGKANVLGNVYGGGNKGAVSGSSRVLIQDQEIQNN